MYLLFAYEEYKACGGMGDLKAAFATEQQCLNYIIQNYKNKNLHLHIWYQYEIIKIISETEFIVIKRDSIDNLIDMAIKEKPFFYYSEEPVGVSGVRPARRHQQTARNILYNLLQNISWSKHEPIMEASMDDSDISAKSPDLMVINRKLGHIEIIFEICRTSQVNENREKVLKMIEHYQGIEEGFIYDYEADKWYKLTPKKEYQRECYVSNVLGKDMQYYVTIERRGIIL